MVETPTPSASFAAGPGTTTRGTPAPCTAIGTTRMTATTTSAFGAPEFTIGRCPNLNRPSSTAPHPARQNAKTAGALVVRGDTRRRLAGWSPLLSGVAS